MDDRSEFWVRTEFDVDEIKDHEQRKRVSELMIKVDNGQITLEQLWQRFSASVKDDKILNDDYWDVRLVIRSIFGIPKADDINNSIKKLLDRLDTIDAKLRNHRHDTTKQFSAKPEF